MAGPGDREGVADDETIAVLLAAVAQIPLSALVRQTAATLHPVELRTLDAIHLASALALGNDLASVVTYDQRMATAANALGLQVVAPACVSQAERLPTSSARLGPARRGVVTTRRGYRRSRRGARHRGLAQPSHAAMMQL